MIFMKAKWYYWITTILEFGALIIALTISLSQYPIKPELVFAAVLFCVAGFLILEYIWHNQMKRVIETNEELNFDYVYPRLAHSHQARKFNLKCAIGRTSYAVNLLTNCFGWKNQRVTKMIRDKQKKMVLEFIKTELLPDVNGEDIKILANDISVKSELLKPQFPWIRSILVALTLPIWTYLINWRYKVIDFQIQDAIHKLQLQNPDAYIEVFPIASEFGNQATQDLLTGASLLFITIAGGYLICKHCLALTLVEMFGKKSSYMKDLSVLLEELYIDLERSRRASNRSSIENDEI